MPNSLDKKRLPKALDRRVKLTEDDKERIISLHKKNTPIREIARQFENICSRRSIQFVIFPERLATVREQFKERRKDGRYYNREKNTKAIRSLRNYKKQNKDKLL